GVAPTSRDIRDGASRALGERLGLGAARLTALRERGENLGYNAYGDTEVDLIVHPVALYRTLSRYADPFRLIENEPLLSRIDAARRSDLVLARELKPTYTLASAIVYVLPDAAWSRRVRGALGNELANRFPDLACAIL